MTPELETFVLYYVCWHEGDFSLVEMRQQLIAELGEVGLKEAIEQFRSQRLARVQAGDRRTYYVIQKT